MVHSRLDLQGFLQSNSMNAEWEQQCPSAAEGGRLSDPGRPGEKSRVCSDPLLVLDSAGAVSLHLIHVLYPFAHAQF